MTDDQPVSAEARTEPEEESMTRKEAAIEALDRLADQAVNTAGDERGRGAAIQDHGLVMRALREREVLGETPAEATARDARFMADCAAALAKWHEAKSPGGD